MTELKNQDTSPCKGIMRDPVHFLAFGLGSGCSPRAPGTFGTVVAIPVYLLLSTAPLWLYLFVTLIMLLVGIWLCDKTTRKLGVHDHKGIVWDEIVGYLITMIAAPKGWLWIIIGFVLFRLFDILKPWPISVADKQIKGGFGIMIDDVLAGIAAFSILHIIAYYTIAL